jgi:hypothetical protein
MIGLVLLYFVGKAFYNLAGEHNKSQWGFAILGVVSYYIGLFVGAFVIGIVYVAMEADLEGTNDFLLGLMALPVGVLTCWGFYKLLEFQWSKTPTFNSAEEVLDANLIDHNTEDPK